RSGRHSAARAEHPSPDPPEHHPRTGLGLLVSPLVFQVDANSLQPLDPALPPCLITGTDDQIHPCTEVVMLEIEPASPQAQVEALELACADALRLADHGHHARQVGWAAQRDLRMQLLAYRRCRYRGPHPLLEVIHTGRCGLI